MGKAFMRLLLIILAGLTLISALERTAPLLAAETAGPSTESMDGPFGVNFIDSLDVEQSGSATVARRYAQARDLGVQWHRWPLYWSEVQDKNAGQWDFSGYDSIVDADASNGILSSVVLTGTPAWASTSGLAVAREPRVGDRVAPDELMISGVSIASASSVPGGLYQPVFLPDGSINTQNAWGYFVYNVVNRYKGRVRAWEMWNEPDWSWFWSGSTADYYRLLKVGYAAAKRADPTARVLFAGLAYWYNPSFLSQVLDADAADPTAAANAYYFDVLALHFYVDPRYFVDKPAWARGEMQKRGIWKPIWVNEANISLCGDANGPSCPSRWRASTDEQASYIIQAFAYAFAAGVEKIFIFQLVDDGNSELFGLVRNDGSTRPSYQAYQTATRYLSSLSVTSQSLSDTLNMVTFSNGSARRTTTLWNYSGQARTAQVASTAAQASLVDKLGRTTTVRPTAGKFNVSLPAATNQDDGTYVIGGSPYLLVEDAPPAPQLRMYLPVTRK